MNQACGAFSRVSGLLLHVTSLPGRFGCGDLGAEAYRFVDFLREAKQAYWQILPLGPTGYGNCPYSSFSAFAGNHFLISVDKLLEHGLLESADLSDVPPFPVDRVDFGWVIDHRMKLLRRAHALFQKRDDLQAEFQSFCADNRSWLEDYALFMALKEKYQGRSWSEWSAEDQACSPTLRAHYQVEMASAIGFHEFLQFEFTRQWHALREYANAQGVKFVGDIPIFVGYDSADVWANKTNFQLNADYSPRFIAGCPPDNFSATGQRWGNPHYDWPKMQAEGFDWWLKRFGKQFELYDVIRIDHFRGFEAYWEIEGGAPTAENGRWVNPPGQALFDCLRDAYGHEVLIIAEDLGTITPEVTKLRRDYGFPGMKILQFGFESCNPSDAFLPANFETDCVVYTGTHDNDTTLGWYRASPEHIKNFMHQYIPSRNERDVVLEMIKMAWASNAVIAIIPLQDLLVLGTEARMNFPGIADHQWEFRYKAGDLRPEHATWLRELTQACGRTPA